MGIIKSIRMGGRGVFCDQQSSFEDCVTANFIYGPNGSGKSTISNFLKDQSIRDSQPSNIEWTGSPSEVVVYNKEWREANFRDQQNFPGVFTLGSDSVEAQKKLDELQEKLHKARNKIESADAQLTEKEKLIDSEKETFQNSVWTNILKPNEDAFAPALTGYRGSRSKFAAKLLEKSGEEPSIPFEELKAQIADVFSGEPNTFDNIDIDSIEGLISNLMDVESCDVWELAITGNQDVDIAALISSLGSSDWVRQGLSYIKETDQCPFCQKHTITPELKHQLEQFFDDQYEVNLRKVKSCLTDYRSAAETLCSRIEAISNCPFVASRNSQYRQDLESSAAEFHQAIDENILAMKNKVAEPSRKISLKALRDFYDRLLQRINAIDAAIDEHNAAILNINKERERLANEAWVTLRKLGAAAIQSHNDTLKKLEGAKKGFEKTIAEQQGFENSFTEQIVEVRKGITSIQPTVDEINASLKAYGFDGFSIQPSNAAENAYQIVRPDGTPAGRTLSEGEETFVAFLYFMQLIKGSVDPNRFTHEKVVVIDDPICSLDSTVLYIVSCMVKQLIDDAKNSRSDVKQVFVLTHNAFFHKEASFSKGKAYDDGKTKYWTIQKHGNQSSVKDHGRTNPIKTSYELLWEEVKDHSTTTIALQNSMRRIIENYFRMLGKDKSDQIENKFETVEEKIICRSLFAWMNDGSHSIPDDLYIDSYSESPDKYRQVFRRVFEVSENIEHYKMMMGETLQETAIKVGE